MEEPFRRTAIGFDTNDHTLDVVVSSDLKWSWKDEQSMSERVSAGQYSNEFAAAVRAEAEQVVKSIELRLSPFCDGWEKWVPDSTWGIPP